ncbi:hypothetical protein GCM10027168_09130 [Streptomyces capparidis]
MAITQDLRKTLTDPTPLYAVAGTAVLAGEKLREVPALLEKVRAEAPERLASLRETAAPQKVGERAKEAQTKLVSTIDPRHVDLKQLRDSAQSFALRQVGRAAEAAVQARETYDELAERGQRAVHHLRGELAENVEDAAVAIEPEPLEKKEPAAGTAERKAPAARRAPARRPAAKRTPTASTAAATAEQAAKAERPAGRQQKGTGKPAE